METTRLLDSYRIALARDAIAVHLLSLLQRDGAQTDVSLAALAHTTIQETKKKLTELFRANFVQLVGNQRYSTTDMAEQVLATLGVTDAVGSDAVASSSLPDQDKQFLITWFSNREHDPPNWRRFVAAAAKTTLKLEQRANLDEETNTRLWYAVIMGLDPATHELNHNIACKRALDHADIHAGNILFETKYFVNRCKVATLDRFLSNDFVATGYKKQSPLDGEVTLALTLTRLLASIRSQYMDDGLVAAVSEDGVNENARKLLKDWISPFEIDYIPIFEDIVQWGDSPQNANPIDTLCSALPLTLGKWHATLPNAQVQHDGATTVIPLLREVEARIRGGKVSRLERLKASMIVGRIRSLLASKAPKPPKSER